MKLLSKFKMLGYLVIIGIGLVSTMGSSFMGISTSKYVDGTNGSDTNNGLTTSTSWKTIQKAVSSVQPGDTIVVRNGTYNENIVVSISGTAASPITMTNFPGETVVINGGTGIAIRSSGQVSYWTLDGLTIKGTNRYTLRLGWYGEPMTDHWTIKNNKIFGANYIMGSYHLWENNTIDGTGYPGTSGDAGISDGGDSNHNTYRYNVVKNFTNVDARGIWTQGKTHDSLIEYNTVDNIKTASGLGQCIDLDGAAQVEWRHTVRGNTVSNCSYVGIQLENVFASVVEDNNIRNTGPAGIIIISYDAGVKCLKGGESGQYGDQNGDNNCQGDLTNNIIRQNIITTTTGWGAGYGGIINWYAGGVNYWGNTINAAWGNNNGGINIQGNASQIKGNSIKDNIITQGKGPAVCVSDLKNLAEEKNNLYNRVSSTKPFTSGSGCSVDYSISEFQTMTGLGQNTIAGDPAYKNASTGDLRLSSISAAIDKGMDIGTKLDADSNTRLVGPSQDIGAYEYGSIVPTAAPTSQPTVVPTSDPTVAPTTQPTVVPTANPTVVPTSQPTVGPVGYGTYDDLSPQIAYTGSWLEHTIPGNYLNTEEYSYKVGSTAKLTFTGEAVTVIYRGYPKYMGVMGIKIDGVNVGTINLYSSSQIYQLQWSSANLGTGVHTIEMIHQSGTYIVLDGIIVSGPPVAESTSQPTVRPTMTLAPTTTVPTIAPVVYGKYDDQNAQIKYSGSWLYHTITGNYLNTEEYSYKIGSTAQFTFSGEQITVLYRGYQKLMGKMGIKIDGVNVGTINLYSSSQKYQLQWSSANLGPGVHTIVMTHQSGTYVVLDGLIVSGPPTAASTSQPTVKPTIVPTAMATATPTSKPVVLPTEVPTLMNIDNVALGKPSDQSSVYESSVSGRAVDGNTDGVYADNSVTHTQEDSQSWWQVDLGNNYLIQTINVWTRTDCCEWRLNNFYILVSDQPFTSTDLTGTINQAGVSNYYIAGNGGRPTAATINRTGRYVRVQLSGRDSLSLAEVQVIGNTTPVTNLTNIAEESGSPTVAPTDVTTIEVMNTPTPTPTQEYLPQDGIIPTYSMEMTPTP